MFKQTTINLGEIKVGSQHTLEFPYEATVNYIQRVVSPCECTDVRNYAGSRKIVATFTARDIPFHLKMEGIDQVEKKLTINVEYLNNDGTEEKQDLTFTALVKE